MSDVEAGIRERYEALSPHLDERARRLLLAAEAKVLGRGGAAAVGRATGASSHTIQRGVDELAGREPMAAGQVRRPGGGRKTAEALEPELPAALDALIEPTTRGDPESPLRQWVLTMPWGRRALFARRPDLMQGVIAVALRWIERWYRRASGRLSGEGASATVIQRVESSLSLNPHAHALVLDGVYVEDARGELVFRRSKPGTRDVSLLAEQIARASEQWLSRQGFPGEEGGEVDGDDGLALIQAASLGGVVAVGPRSGRSAQRTQRLGGRERPLPARCASFGLYNLHAGVAVRAGDRVGLERLARYVLRPPLAGDRLSR